MIYIIKKYYLLAIFSIGFLFSYTNNETGWEYFQGTRQTFYMFENILIDSELGYGDGQPANNYDGYCINNPYQCDVIGAFVNRDENEYGDLNGDGEISSSVEICVGWNYVNSDSDNSFGFTTLALIGQEEGDLDTYLLSGESPFLKVYDHTNDVVLPLDLTNSYYTETLIDCNSDQTLCDGDNGWESDMGNGVWDDETPAEPFEDIDGDGVWDASEFEDLNGNGILDEEEVWFDLNGDGIVDFEEPYTDINGDGQWNDILSAELFADINLNGTWDGNVYEELLGFANNEIFLYYGSVDAYNILGCNNSSACNFEQEATEDDGSCILPPSGQLITSGVVNENSFEFYFDDSLLDGTQGFSHQVIVTQGFSEIFNEINASSPIQIDNLEWSTTYSIEVITTNFDVCETLPNSNYPLRTYENIQTDPMPQPEQVFFQNVVPGEGQVFLEWDEVDYGSVYRIFENEILLDSLIYPLDEMSFMHNELAPGLSYDYQIQAVNMEGLEGDISEISSVTTLPLSSVELDSLLAGQGQIQLNWSMESSQYADQNYSFDIYVDDQYLINRFGSSYTVSNLNAGQEYCFYVEAKIELPVDGDLIEFIANQSSTLCGVPEEISGWSVLIEVDNSVNTVEDGAVTFYDSYNEIGMNPDASDGYDEEFDFPEPPINPSPGAVSLSFYHPEWNFNDLWGNYFTTDLRSLKDLSKSLEVYEGTLSFTASQGLGNLYFNLVSNAGNNPVFLNWTDQYYLVSDGGNVPFYYDETVPTQFNDAGLLNPNYSDQFNFVFGNQPPSIPENLEAIGESRNMMLDWDLNIDCSNGQISCNNYRNRYPATSYKIFRSWAFEINPQLVGLVGTRHHKISIFPSDLSGMNNSLFSDTLFSILDNPSDGFIQAEYFEDFTDLNQNNIHDYGEEFIDCGWDGLCPGDPGYESEFFIDENNNNIYDLGEQFEDSNLNGIWDQNGPDKGENDGQCNIVYYYQAYGYLTEGLDSLSYSNGIYDIGETYTDENQNNQWDDGEDYVDSRKLMIKISDQVDNEFIDYGLRTGTQYFYNIVASNLAGDSDLSIMDSGNTADNQPPISDAGVDQKRYLTSISQDSILCTLPLDNVDLDQDGYPDYDINGFPILDHINNSYDPDGLAGEELLYSWELYDPDLLLFGPGDPSGSEPGWFNLGNDKVLSIMLPESNEFPDSSYTIRLLVEDISGYPDYSPDIMQLEVTRDIPVPAMITNQTASPSLYYIALDWDKSEYDLPGGPNPAPEGYDGDLDIADYYVVYRDSVEHEILTSDYTSYVDTQLNPSQEYCYYLVATNETGPSIPSDENCYVTGDLPIPNIVIPTGGEILISGQSSEFNWISDIDLSPLSESEYIDTLRVLHSSDAGLTWEVIPGASWSYPDIPDSYVFQVPEVDTISFRNKFKVEVLDIGDYSGVDQVLHSDISEYLIVIANDELENNYASGWNIVSSPLGLSSSSVDDIFDVDSYCFGLFDQDGGSYSCTDTTSSQIDFQASQGYYMVSEDEVALDIEGDVLVETFPVVLEQGWNLIGHPLVSKVLVDSLEVIDPSNFYGIPMTWDEAVSSQLLMSSIHGFNNELKMHAPVDVLEPFQGYWIHASRELQLMVSPHIYDEDLYSREDGFLLSITTAEVNPQAPMLVWKDMIKIGLSPLASDDWVYGQDEYDIPIDIATPTSFPDLWIDHPEWYEDGITESRSFYSDMQQLNDDSRKSWYLKGELRGNDAEAQINLSWEFENLELLGEDEVNLIVGQEIIDMRSTNSVTIDRIYFGNMQVVIGILSCEDEGLVTCADGACAESLDQCSCDSQELVDCGDGTCVEDIEDCSCDSQGLIECEDGVCVETEEECGELNNEIPDKFSISAPYPNPFNPNVKFDFSLPAIAHVGVNVYNINGAHVEQLINGIKPAGYHSVVWNAGQLSAGMYFIQFSSSQGNKTMKVLLIK